jgi:hypothetical protein
MSPALIGRKPMMAFNRLDLPHPFGPTIAVSRPLQNRTETSLSTFKGP